MLKIFLFSVTVFGFLFIAGGDSRANQWATGEPVMVPCLSIYDYHQLRSELDALDCSISPADCVESRDLSSRILKEYFGFDEVMFAQPLMIWESRRTRTETAWAKRVAMSLESILPKHDYLEEWRNLRGRPIQSGFDSADSMPVWLDEVPRYQRVVRFDSQAQGLNLATKYGKSRDGVSTVTLTLTVGAPIDQNMPIPFGSFRDLMVFMTNHRRN